jgi:hypothetical protein
MTQNCGEAEVSACLRFEKLLDKDELTDEEFQFCVEHQRNCPLGIHTDEGLERQHGLSPGALKNWNGRDPLPSSDVEARRRHVRRLWHAITTEEATAEPTYH